MNTDRLARHYDTLTPWERLPLIVAAFNRGDKVEEERLSHSAPSDSYRVPNYFGLAAGLDDLAKMYLLQQLDAVALHWRWLHALEGQPVCGGRGRLRGRKQNIARLLRMSAYRYVVRLEGWMLLCDELHMDADVLLRPLPGYEVVQGMEDEARRIAFSAKEALAYLRGINHPNQSNGSDASPPRGEYAIDTAADVAAAMRASLQDRLDWWC